MKDCWMTVHVVSCICLPTWLLAYLLPQFPEHISCRLETSRLHHCHYPRHVVLTSACGLTVAELRGAQRRRTRMAPRTPRTRHGVCLSSSRRRRASTSTGQCVEASVGSNCAVTVTRVSGIAPAQTMRCAHVSVCYTNCLTLHTGIHCSPPTFLTCMPPNILVYDCHRSPGFHRLVCNGLRAMSVCGGVAPGC
jgi:hypothetical protein